MAGSQTKVTGIVGLVPSGTWSASIEYKKLSVVRYGTGLYIARQPSIGIEPGVNPNSASYWMLAVTDGGNLASVVSGTPADNGDGYTSTPVTFTSSGGYEEIINVLAKNGNAGVNVTTQTVTLAANAWTSSSPYRQTVTVQGVTSDSLNIITAPENATSAQLETIYNANLSDGGQTTNSITVRAYGTLPNSNISVRVITINPTNASANSVYETINNTLYGGQ